MELSSEEKQIYIETAKKLTGSDRRMFMARVVKGLGRGGQRLAAGELGWGRNTIIKGRHELESGIMCIDNFSSRGRKRAEDHLPHLLVDIQDIVDTQTQTDPTFKSRRLYTRLSARQVRQQLILHKGYTDEELPTQETIRVKLNALGYQLRSVAKSRPQKKSQKPTASSIS